MNRRCLTPSIRLKSRRMEKKNYMYLVPVCRYWQQTNMLLAVSSSNKSNDRPNIKIHTNIDAQMKGEIKEKQRRYACSIPFISFCIS